MLANNNRNRKLRKQCRNDSTKVNQILKDKIAKTSDTEKIQNNVERN